MTSLGMTPSCFSEFLGRRESGLPSTRIRHCCTGLFFFNLQWFPVTAANMKSLRGEKDDNVHLNTGHALSRRWTRFDRKARCCISCSGVGHTETRQFPTFLISSHSRPAATLSVDVQNSAGRKGRQSKQRTDLRAKIANRSAADTPPPLALTCSSWQKLQEVASQDHSGKSRTAS